MEHNDGSAVPDEESDESGNDEDDPSLTIICVHSHSLGMLPKVSVIGEPTEE